MIDKTIGVIPPRNELSSFPEKKAENSKDKKSEFESILNQSSRQAKKPDKKEGSDQALGGTKKKVPETDRKLESKSEKTKKDDNETETEGVDKKRKQKLVNEEMVLGSMASIESANKAPDSEVNPDNLEKTNLTSAIEAKPVADETVALAGKNPISDEAIAEIFDGQLPLPETLPDEAVDAIVAQLAQAPQVDPKGQTETVAAFLNPIEAAEQVNPTAQLAVESSDIVPDSKVLETLNREQMFQKLEMMKKTEDTAKVETKNSMDGISTLPVDTSSESSTSFQSADQGQDDLGHEDHEAVQLGTVAHHQSHVKQEFLPVVEAQINKPDRTADADAANLKEILNQAQYLVTQGGGEVSVKMTPEGMGEVQLKIMMENGKMNLEMNTHDKNVQKLIQDSLSDLKSSLAAHQISVEHVTLNNKINTVNDAERTSSSQNFTDSQAHKNPQQSHQRDQRQQAGQVLQHETLKALPLAKNEMNKASAHRVYQTHKANSLNAVA